MPEIVQPKPRRSRKIDKGKAISLVSKGLTYQEIGKQFGVSPGAVCKSIKPILDSLLSKEDLKAYREKEIALIDSARAQYLVAALNEDKLKSASALQCVTGFGILTDKSLLLQGKATQIVENKSLVLTATKRLEEMESMIRDAQVIDSETLDTPGNVDKSVSD